jgi:hypothetical protein
MAAATDSILVASWWWESDFEMVRDPFLHPYLTEEERWHNTILGTLAWDTPATKRVLVGQFWGQDSILSWMSTDPELRAFADFTGDGFEFMGQANETEGTPGFSMKPARRSATFSPEAALKAAQRSAAVVVPQRCRRKYACMAARNFSGPIQLSTMLRIPLPLL